MPPEPLVLECAWHPKYFGTRQFVIKKRLRPRITDAELAAYVQDAIRRGAVTHGLCARCRPKFQAEIEAHRANPNGGPSTRIKFKEVQAALRRVGISIRHDAYNHEYRVTYQGLPQPLVEHFAYYTSDLLDAYQTGLDMAKRKIR